MRLKRWSENGLLWKIFYKLKQRKLVRMDIVFMDSTTVKAHRCGRRARRKKGGEAGRNVAGTGTEIHVIMGEKRPLRVQVSGATVHDSQMAYRLMDELNLKVVKRFLWIKGVITTSLFGT
jgi:hypothetical protein